MNNIKLFEGQEVQVKTDKGNTLINLVHVAKACGLIKNKTNGTMIVNWKSGSASVCSKLNLLSSGGSSNISLRQEILNVLEDMNDISNRQNIYISIGLAKDLSNMCNNSKGINFYNYLMNNYFDFNYKKVTTIRKEIVFLDKLEEALKSFNSIGIRQYRVEGYRIDYYIKELNIAIEYDENGHANYAYEKEEGRQKEIENKLDCSFIRISDKNSDEYNIGYVIKELFKINKVA